MRSKENGTKQKEVSLVDRKIYKRANKNNTERRDLKCHTYNKSVTRKKGKYIDFPSVTERGKTLISKGDLEPRVKESLTPGRVLVHQFTVFLSVP